MTECYGLVRGSAIRVTALDAKGAYDEDDLRYVVSKSVASVRIEEVTESGANDMLRNDDGERRMRLVSSERTIRYRISASFLRVDPGLLSLMTGVPLVTAERPVWNFGFGEGPFGIVPFGGGAWAEGVPITETETAVIGFDAALRRKPASFGLEVWSKLAGRDCTDGPRWGYTLFPFLKGGRVSGVTFANGLISFNMVGATTRRMPKWDVGPYFLDGWCPLVEPVSRNTHWRQTIVSLAPPAQTDGVVTLLNEIDGGTASMTTPDELDGGTPFEAGPCVVNGGAA